MWFETNCFYYYYVKKVQGHCRSLRMCVAIQVERLKAWNKKYSFFMEIGADSYWSRKLVKNRQVFKDDIYLQLSIAFKFSRQ